MALEITKSPAAVSQVGNDILFRIHTDNMYSEAGEYAFIGMNWLNGDDADEWFSIQWGTTELVFTAKASPDLSGTQYKSYVSGSLETWIKSIIPYLEANYLLTKFFTIAWNDAEETLEIKAISKGSEYTITFDAGTSNSSAYNNAGVNPVAREFYHLYVRVWESYPQLHKLLGEDMLVPDADGNCDFKIQEYLAGELQPGYSYPVEPGEFLIKSHPEMCVTYFIQFTETYSNEFGGLISSEATETVVISGKIPKSKMLYLESIEKTLFDYIHEKKRFLSWYSGNKTVSEDTPEKLYFLNHNKAHTLYLKTTIYYGINSSQILTSFNIISEIYEVLELSVGFKDLELDTIGFDVHSYKVQITSDLAYESEPRTYIVDKTNQPNEKIFLFLNSFGVYETLRTTGQSSKTNQFEHTVIEQVSGEDSDQLTRLNINSLKEESFSCNTGWISKEIVDWMNDFLLSPEVYLNEDGEMIPLVITSKKVFQHKDNEYLFSVDFEYSKSEITSVHAPKIEF